MSVVINTNVDSIRIQNILSDSTSKLSSAMQRMSTGLKVNSAKDDAAGTVIAAKMAVQLNGNKIAQQNVQNANAMLATAEGNLDVVEDNLTRIRDLTLQAKNGTYSSEEIQAMQDEVGERVAELTRINSSSKYSSLKLFSDDSEHGLQKEGVTFQVGANKDDDNTISADKKIFGAVDFDTLTKKDGSGLGADFDLTKLSTAASFQTALDKIDAGINNITERKSQIGSAENRLESALNTLTTQFENLSSAKSIITDADIASEASAFTQQNILQQVSTSLLAQANQAPGIALSLV